MRRSFLAFVAFALATGTVRGAEIVFVAAASDLVFCLNVLHEEFRRGHPNVGVAMATGSSGNFFAQIQQGAPYDVFLSADLRYPRELVAAGQAEESSLTPYAIGRIVLWTTRTDLEPTDLGAVLRNPLVRKFAIANPAHAPYGRAAREALEHNTLWELARTKLVLGDNVVQTAQFVKTGNADAGILALSLVLAPSLRDLGRWTLIPAEHHTPLEQGAVLTKKGAANPAAGRYLQFLSSPEARAVFERFGFRLPPGNEGQ